MTSEELFEAMRGRHYKCVTIVETCRIKKACDEAKGQEGRYDDIWDYSFDGETALIHRTFWLRPIRITGSIE
jgi:hypothetical protein